MATKTEKPACEEKHCEFNQPEECPYYDEITEWGYDAALEDNCHRDHAADFSYDIQGIYSRLTGDHTDWYRCTTEPWWSLGALLHATAV